MIDRPQSHPLSLGPSQKCLTPRRALARGIKGNVTLHDGPTRKPRTVINIENAAPWCIGSNLERYKWKAPEVSDSSPHTGEDGYLVIPTMPDDDQAVA